MTYYGPKEIAESFRTVRKNTLQIAQDIPAEKYSFRPASETRSVGELLTHVALVSNFQLTIHQTEKRKTLEGFDFPAYVAKATADEKSPRSKEQVIELLTTNGETFARFLEGLDENFLAEKVAMPAGAPYPSKSRFEMLISAKEHEMHHRGQLMLIERMIGIVPHMTRQMQAGLAAHAAAAKR
jgi:uncharacterized damage-inducible protein DinB